MERYSKEEAPSEYAKEVWESLEKWDEEMRIEFIQALRSEFCFHCGSDSPVDIRGCQCTNDE